MSLSRALSRDVSVRARRSGVAVLALTLAAFALVLVPATPASATGPSSSPNFVCAADVVYSVDGGSHELSKINPTAGTSTSNGAIPAGHKDDINALALPNAGGRYIYAFNRSQNQILRFDAATNDADTWNAPSNSSASSVIAGAINPANGIYYYAAGGSTWKLFAFDTNTNTSIGQVGTIAGLSNNGDMAFDATGNLYVVSNASSTAAGTLARVNGPLPTTAGTPALASTFLTNLPDNSGQYASMAFDGSGYLVIGTGSGKVLKVNPSTGALVQTKTVSLSLSDMASCSTPSTATARVNLPQGRHDAADQFKVTLTGNGVTTGNAGTTTGADSGVQTDAAEMAGPVVVLPSTTYTITQTAAGGTDFNDYTTTWACVKGSDGSTIASGTGNTGTFTMPSTSGSTVVCTFTNLPLIPAISLDKTAGAINDVDANGPDAGDTVTYTFKVTNTGNMGLNPVTVADAKVGAVTCPSGSLAVGASINCTAAAYVLTQADVNAGKVDNSATATGKASNGVSVTSTDTATVTIPAHPVILLDKVAGAIVDQDANGPDAGDKIELHLQGDQHRQRAAEPGLRLGRQGRRGHLLAEPARPGCLGHLHGGGYVADPGRRERRQGGQLRHGDGHPADRFAGHLDGHRDRDDPGGPGDRHRQDRRPARRQRQQRERRGRHHHLRVRGHQHRQRHADDVAVNDPMFGAITCPKTTLAPGETMTCSPKTYALVLADVNAGKVTNTATVTGTPPAGPWSPTPTRRRRPCRAPPRSTW